MSSRWHAPAGLRGRRHECDLLDAEVQAIRAGQSRALVLRGEAGIGKSELFEYVARRASDLRVVRAAGVESEMEMPYAAVHQLSRLLGQDFQSLPPPQRVALQTALGLASGPPPDRFFVGLALLSHLSEMSRTRPLVCLVDDAHWLDRSSAQVLSFVARRLRFESVLLILAERDGDRHDEFAGLPELRVRGLSDEDALDLVASVHPGPLDPLVRVRLLTEARGNPLALLELPKSQLSAHVSDVWSVPTTIPTSRRIEASYLSRVASLPAPTQQLLIIAAADPLGDPGLLWRATSSLNIPMDAVTAAEAEGLLEIEGSVRFRHPLLRSAIYQAASPSRRREAHRALAAATDPDKDPDHRAWHRAQAALGPDEAVALELEGSASRARARGGLTAAAAFLQRSVVLSEDGIRRIDRALAAAQANLDAGAFDAALGTLAMAQDGPLDDLRSARAKKLRAEIAFAQNRGGEAPLLLLDAARHLERLDARSSRDTYLDAWAAALFAGDLAGAGAGLAEVSRAVSVAPYPSEPVRASDLLLDGLAAIFTKGRPAAVPLLHRAITAFASAQVTDHEMLRWGWLASRAAILIWDYDTSLEIAMRAVQLARRTGALEALAVVDNACGQTAAIGGDFALASTLTLEVEALKDSTGTRIGAHAALSLVGLRGQHSASDLITSAIAEATTAGQGTALQYASWANAVRLNGVARHEEALLAAERASARPPDLWVASWALLETVEAATKIAQPSRARAAFDRLSGHLAACNTEWALGIRARSLALLTEGDQAEQLYREAIDRLEQTQLRPDLARSELLLGEWLRRQQRRSEARDVLRTAHSHFSDVGMEAFAARAQRELAAAGERLRGETTGATTTFTSQEMHVAQLARDGLTNVEIGERLFLSARTVEWHLSKVFAKLGVRSRRDLRAALSQAGPLTDASP